jgi:hypothetical protein
MMSPRGNLLPGFMRRAGLALAVILPGLGIAAREAAPGDNALALFQDPPMEARPLFRWWWPCGNVDPAQVALEVETMVAAGFGGAEIADVHHSIREPLDAAGHGWGTESWNEGMRAALRAAAPHGFRIDLTIGPSWPAAVPTVDPNHPAAMQELAVGWVVVEGGGRFVGPAPGPRVAAQERGTREVLRFAQIARLAEKADASAREIELVAGSVETVAFEATSALLDVAVPAEGRWVLLTYWQRGVGQRPERGPHTEPASFVVDHFSRAGAEAVIEFWESRILDDELRALLAATGGYFFEDSIEMETEATLWTPGLEAIFEERFGYALLPLLPLVVHEHEKPVFHFGDGLAAQVRHDWWLLLGERLLDHHFKPLQAWARTLGMGLRAQPYGLKTDAVHAAAHLDVPEGESLGFKNLDDYRSLAGGRDLGGRRVLSNESGAFHGGAYGTTWKRMLATLNPMFAAGVNQNVFHGYSYAEAPGARWPGFAAFTPYDGRTGFAESWGPRQPSWAHVRGIADYFARVQAVLQAGVPRVDAAFLRQKGYAGSGFGAPWFSREGGALGWTHSFVSPATLELPLARVRDGRLAPDGPAYRLLVFEGDAFERRAEAMPVETARRLLDFAREGLPMLVVGDWSEPRPSGRAFPGEHAALREIFAELLALPLVVNVPSREDISEGIARLAALGVKPGVAHAPTPFVRAERRVGEQRVLLFSTLPRSGSARATVWLDEAPEGAVARLLDPWTGGVSRLPTERGPDGALGFALEVPADAVRLVAVGPRKAGESLPMATREAPDHSSSSRPPPLVVTGPWKLEVEDWQPGARPSETRKTLHRLELDQLVPWTEIPALAEVSGMGRYRTEFAVPTNSPLLAGASLSLGEVFDTAVVRLNGMRLPPLDPLHPVVDLGKELRAGANVLEIEVSTTLLNRLRVTDPEVYGGNRPQAYGLLGPVVLREAKP